MKGPHDVGPYVTPPAPKPSRTPWIVAIGVIAAALLVLGGVVVFRGGKADRTEDFGSASGTTVTTVARTSSTSSTSTTTSTTTTTVPSTTRTTVAKPGGTGTRPATTVPRPATPGVAAPPYTYGDDWYLDALWDRCYIGDWAACDQLYWETPIGSEYEAYGATCGWTTDWLAGGCVSWYSTPVYEPYTYGDDWYLDSLWDRCYAGDWAACDALYYETPVGSEYEAYGATCGWRTDWLAGGCVTWAATPVTPWAYGDDWYLDGLWDACAAGDWAACDTLYYETAVGSEYEAFGATCGYTTDWLAGGCAGWYATPTGGAFTYGDDAYLDMLWDECAAGNMVSCDILYWDSPVGSEYESFGATCGWTNDWLAGDCEFWTTGF